jgi:hypothetical protein
MKPSARGKEEKGKKWRVSHWRIRLGKSLLTGIVRFFALPIARGWLDFTLYELAAGIPGRDGGC